MAAAATMERAKVRKIRTVRSVDMNNLLEQAEKGSATRSYGIGLKTD
jgi:hypothetical protein